MTATPRRIGSVPPSPLSNTPADWALMQVLGGKASLAFGAEPDIKEWSDRVALNPARVPPECASDPGSRPPQGAFAMPSARGWRR